MNFYYLFFVVVAIMMTFLATAEASPCLVKCPKPEPDCKKDKVVVVDKCKCKDKCGCK